MDNLDNSSNKLFKSDSQRVAFLLCVGFGVLGGMRELRYSVAHTLTGRYTNGGNFEFRKARFRASSSPK
ncbi:DUF3265 domain-containing protein [Vibrio parahaemolyticus]|nr:DUF3265 domain-containing protein [Vibrio parahaemolyticus]EJC6932493.1 DUF3265 domain-containing protein [Vibrio parahaemolyticus]ELA9425969.1 DUF3265 domain-containing protein [Vibrio parahaemolyticus]MBE3840110.1 DUF3265 domain-containing protein [Vibrio parahaemolyticus]MBE4314014.1 DUF3265 domain-containing protein [Vibrio parahaemolyticus]